MEVPRRTDHLNAIAGYQFLQPLGEGPHGRYYLARPPEHLPVNAELVAVKVLQADSQGALVDHLINELQVFAAVESPCLVTLFDAGQEGPSLYYAAEYCPLGSLASTDRTLSRAEVLRALRDAARATHALHEAGIAHGGIKPSNILLHADGGRLTDLDLAHVLFPGQALSGLGDISSVEFVDPAVICGAPISRTADVFALGMTLHHALTAASMYGDVPKYSPLLAVRHVLSTPPQVNPSLDRALRDTICACVDPDLSVRFPTAEALAEQLDTLVTEEVPP